MPRVSSAFERVLREYLNSKEALAADYENENVNQNIAKKGFFQKIISALGKKTLSIFKLIEFFNQLTPAQKQNIFYAASKKAGSVESQAAKHLRNLFGELGLSFDDANWQVLIEAQSVKKITNVNNAHIATLVKAQQFNPYLPGPRLRLEHELKCFLELSVKFYSDSLAKVLFAAYPDFEQTLPALKKIQGLLVCADYIPELLHELMALYLQAKDVVVIGKIKAFVTQANVDAQTKELQQLVVQSHPEVAVFLFLPIDAPQPAVHVDINRGDEKFDLPAAPDIKQHSAPLPSFRAHPQMRQEVHRRLLLKARTDEKMNAAAINFSDKKVEQKVLITPIAVAQKNSPLILKKEELIKSIEIKVKPHIEALKKQAIDRIDRYVESILVAQVKVDFFTQLKAKLQSSEFKLVDLFALIPNPSEVFDKTIGNVRSRAADCIGDIFALMVGRRMTEAELTKLVEDGQFPKVADTILDCYVENIANGVMPQYRALTRTILDGMAEVKTATRTQKETQADFHSRAEAAYQQKLIEVVLNKVKGKALRFDVQGHFLVEAKLEDKDYEALNEQLTGSKHSPDPTKSTADYYKELLGVSKEKDTYCSLDGVLTKADAKIDHNDAKSQITACQVRFKGWVISEGIVQAEKYPVGVDKDKLNEAIDTFIVSSSRSSVVPLQEEMEMQMRLATRPFMDVVGADLWVQVCEQTALAINKEVKKHFQLALCQSYDPKSKMIDFKLLNNLLDKSRPHIIPLCKPFFRKQLQLMGGQKNWVTVLNQRLDNPADPITKHTFEAMTATGLDSFRTDARNQTAVRITATDGTAHNKTVGAQAHRSFHRNTYSCSDQKFQVQALSVTRAEIRVPSIAISNIDHKEAVRDVAAKLKQSYGELQKQLADFDGPMTYNLLTSLHSKTWDFLVDHNNRQRKSAARIHKGAHIFNREQVLAGNLDSLCFVQNIGVNQHTTNLRYEEEFISNDVIGESTLMAELAMLSNFVEHAHVFPPAMAARLMASYRGVQIEYIQFLKNSEQGDLYFKNSAEGQEAVSQLKALKQYMCTNEAGLKAAPGDSLSALAVKVLAKCLSKDHHWTDQFGMLVQALSVFIERACQFGCKSANERYQAVSGRVDLLLSMAHRAEVDHSKQEKAVALAMKSFLANPSANPAQIQKAVDEAYNLHNVYGAASTVSLEDQGAGSKVVASQNGDEESGAITTWEWLTNTNVAESRHIMFSSQKHAAAHQSHKKNHAEEWRTELNGPANSG